MKLLKLTHFLALTLMLISSCQSYGSNLNGTYIEKLKKVTQVQGNGSNKLYTLIRESSVELEKDWSPELAKELARVFNELLNVNQNFFLVELIGPVVNSRKKEFMPILNKALSKENKKHYEEMIKTSERESREGNG